MIVTNVVACLYKLFQIMFTNYGIFYLHFLKLFVSCFSINLPCKLCCGIIVFLFCRDAPMFVKIYILNLWIHLCLVTFIYNRALTCAIWVDDVLIVSLLVLCRGFDYFPILLASKLKININQSLKWVFLTVVWRDVISLIFRHLFWLKFFFLSQFTYISLLCNERL